MDTPNIPSLGKWQRFFGISASLMIPLFLVRLVVDTAVRMVYPFLPQIAAGTQLSIAGFGWLISLRAWIGVAGPIFGVAADRFGPKAVMLFGLASLGLGFLGMFTLTGAWLTAPMVLLGLATSAFMPAQQAFVSNASTFERRGRSLAAVDVSFSVTGLAMLPLVGILIDEFDWRAPFIALCGLSLVAIPVLARLLPDHRHMPTTETPRTPIRILVTQPNVVALVAGTMLLFFGYSSFLTTWSVWLNSRFGFGPIEVGGVATLMGIAEAAGVVLSGLYIDRIGKRRGMLIGLALSTVAVLAWLGLQTNLTLGLIALVALSGLFEFTLVALFPVVAEQAPEARATMFALMSFGASIGMAVGSPVAIQLWESAGLTSVGITIAIALAVTAALTRWKVRA